MTISPILSIGNLIEEIRVKSTEDSILLHSEQVDPEPQLEVVHGNRLGIRDKVLSLIIVRAHEVQEDIDPESDVEDEIYPLGAETMVVDKADVDWSKERSRQQQKR